MLTDSRMHVHEEGGEQASVQSASAQRVLGISRVCGRHASPTKTSYDQQVQELQSQVRFKPVSGVTIASLIW